MFPDRAEIARWYGEDSTCNPTLNRTLFTQQMQLRDQLTWVARNASAFGVQFYDTTITSRYAGQLPPGLQLTKLFDDPYAPLNTMTWVSTPAEFVDALVSQKRPNVVLLSNLTIPPELWPSAPIRLQQNMVIVGWPARCTVLDWEGVSGVVALSNKTMKMRKCRYGTHTYTHTRYVRVRCSTPACLVSRASPLNTCSKQHEAIVSSAGWRCVSFV